MLQDSNLADIFSHYSRNPELTTTSLSGFGTTNTIGVGMGPFLPHPPLSLAAAFSRRSIDSSPNVSDGCSPEISLGSESSHRGDDDSLETDPPFSDVQLFEDVHEAMEPLIGPPCEVTAGSLLPPWERNDFDYEGFDLGTSTSGLVRGIKAVVKAFGGDNCLADRLGNQLSSYLVTDDEKVWVARAKDVLCRPMALFLCNDPPKTPPGGSFEPTGSVRRWYKARLRRYCSENRRLWFTWFQAKRSCFPLSEQYQLGAYKDHHATLTSPDMGDDAFIDYTLESDISIPSETGPGAFVELLDDIARDVLSEYKAEKPFFDNTPSYSACFEMTRSKNGQNGGIKEMIHYVWSPLGFSDLHYMREEGVGWFRSVHSFFMPPGSAYWDLTRHCLEYLKPDADISVFKDLIGAVDEIFPDPWKNLEYLAATIQTVLEPLKCRIISKGNALPYYRMRRLQKAMFNALKKYQCFVPISKPFCPTQISDLEVDESIPDPEWGSIDFKGATDGVSWKYSKRILQRVLRDMDTEYPEVVNEAFKVLGPHRLFYPCKKGGKGGHTETELWDGGMQKKGQLMGSILSFPILCLANLGLYNSTMSLAGHELTKSKLVRSVFVNGDDMLYLGNKEIFKLHAINGAKVGLEFSVGKAYSHKTYANINSISLYCTINKNLSDSLGRRVYSAVVEPYFNTGLFFGQKKVMTANGPSSEGGSLHSTLNWLLFGCPVKYRCRMLAKFLRRFRNDIGRELSVAFKDGRYERKVLRNLFLPISVGGGGVIPPDGWRYFITSDQKLLAKSIVFSAPGMQQTQQLPLPGRPPSEHVDSYPWYNPTDKVIDVPSEDRVISLPKREYLESFSLPDYWSRGIVNFEYHIKACQGVGTFDFLLNADFWDYDFLSDDYCLV
jgi:hypothetical protein